MEVIPFIVESVPEAVAQIRARLGPDAVVVSVRRLEAGGLARLWQKPRLEVLACRQAAAAEESSSAAQELDTVQTQLQPLPIEAAAPAARDPGQAFSLPPSPLRQAEGAPDPGGVMYPGEAAAEAMARLSRGGWRIEEILGRAGFLQPQAKQVADALRAEHGHLPVQVAHPGGAGGRGQPHHVASGRGDRQPRGVPQCPRRDFGRAGRARLARARRGGRRNQLH